MPGLIKWPSLLSNGWGEDWNTAKKTISPCILVLQSSPILCLIIFLQSFSYQKKFFYLKIKPEEFHAWRSFSVSQHVWVWACMYTCVHVCLCVGPWKGSRISSSDRLAALALGMKWHSGGNPATLISSALFRWEAWMAVPHWHWAVSKCSIRYNGLFEFSSLQDYIDFPHTRDR